MTLPSLIKVKISSEEAGLIALTPVLVQQLPSEELVALMLGVTRKDPVRVAEILQRGSLVVGGSRFRWEPLRLEQEEIQAILRRYPDSDPARPFDWDRCKLVRFRDFTMSPESASRKRLLRRTSFWKALQEVVIKAEYVEYSYKDRADLFRRFLDEDEQSRLRAAANLLSYPTLAHQIRDGELDRVEMMVSRQD